MGALDMLFCALGAIMLIFAMQERVVIEQAQDPASQSKVAALTQSNKTLEAAAATRATQWVRRTNAACRGWQRRLCPRSLR